MKIIELRGENIKRLKAVTIRPSGSTVVIGGKNEAGKTSVLDVISAAIGGRKLCPEMPIRVGHKSAKAQVTLGGENGEITVTRKFTPGKSTLTIKPKDGSKSPQALLDELVGELTFDPLEFARMKPVDQCRILRKLAGVDTSALEAKRNDVYDQRTIVNRDLAKAKARLGKAAWHDDAPECEVALADLVAERASRDMINAQNKTSRHRLEAKREQVTMMTSGIRSKENELEALKAELTETIKEGKFMAAAADKLADKDVGEITAKIASAEEDNQKTRENHEHAALEDEFTAAELESNRLDETLSEIDDEITSTLSGATYPVDGLSADNDSVSLDGIPLAQSSSAQRLKCSVAIGLALNPTLRVMRIMDGSLLDSDGLAAIETMADEANAQIWIERVSEGDECAVIIEDGEVRGATKVETPPVADQDGLTDDDECDILVPF